MMSKTPAKKRRKPLFRTESEVCIVELQYITDSYIRHSQECVEDGESQSTGLAGQPTSGNILRFYRHITHTPLPSNYRLSDRKRRQRRATNFSHPLTPARCSEEEEENLGGDKKEEERKKPTSQDGLIGGAGDLLEDGGSWNAGGLEGEEEDLLRGLCPEDLSFSLNTSNCPQTIPVSPSSIPGDGGTERGQDSGHIPHSPVCVKMGEKRVEEGDSSLFGLPPLVKSLLKEHRGICQLYGNNYHLELAPLIVVSRADVNLFPYRSCH